MGKEATCGATLAGRRSTAKAHLDSGQRVCVRGITDTPFLAELTERLGAEPARACRATYDTIFAGFETARDLAALPELRRHVTPAGALWLIAPKGKDSPLPERELRAALLAADLVDVKVAAFSATHTAHKAVIPLALRGPRS